MGPGTPSPPCSFSRSILLGYGPKLGGKFETCIVFPTCASDILKIINSSDREVTRESELQTSNMESTYLTKFVLDNSKPLLVTGIYSAQQIWNTTLSLCRYIYEVPIGSFLTVKWMKSNNYSKERLIKAILQNLGTSSSQNIQ